MALIPPAILAALIGASAGNAIRQFNNPQPKNRITFEPNPTEMAPRRQPDVAKPKPVTVNLNTQGGSSRKIQKRKSASTVIRQPIARSAISRNVLFDGITLSHCEPFGSISMLALGALNYFGTPMLPWNFPYLAGLASNFSKFKWLKLAVYYVPSCPTSTLGECAMGTYFDQQDATAATFIQTSQLKGGISFPPWGGGPERGTDAVRIDFDVNNFDKPRYNYIGNGPWGALSLSDRNNYTPASLAVASQGSTLAAFAGRLWCEYTVRLIDPIPVALNA